MVSLLFLIFQIALFIAGGVVILNNIKLESIFAQAKLHNTQGSENNNKDLLIISYPLSYPTSYIVNTK